MFKKILVNQSFFYKHVYPLLSYCYSVWLQHTNDQINKIIQAQHNFTIANTLWWNSRYFCLC